MKTRDIAIDTAYGAIEVTVTDAVHAHVTQGRKSFLQFRGAEYTASVHLWRNKEGEWSTVNPSGESVEVYIYKRIGVNRTVAAPTHEKAIVEEILQSVQVWSDAHSEVFIELQAEQEQEIFEQYAETLVKARKALQEAEENYIKQLSLHQEKEWFNKLCKPIG